ncbi:phosphoribosylamine--glycine ligase [soil metagenome]
MKVLLIGSGGREHALAWKLAQSPLLTKLYAAPGNPGIAEHAEIVAMDVTDHAAVVRFCRQAGIDFVVVGPDAPVVAGIVDDLAAGGIRAFGPTKAAAQLEGSKTFTKALCDEAGIPTAKWKRFTAAGPARDYIAAEGAPIVVKADGLAAGKGVTVAATVAEAIAAVDGCLTAPGTSVVIEECLVGEEASFFVLCDGVSILPLPSAQDHKRAFDGDQGPNTGGMGAYSPAPVMTEAVTRRALDEIIRPTVALMRKRGMPFRGVLFAGLMVTAEGPKLIEYNARFGDPETQVLMMRLSSDLLPLLLATADGTLASVAPPQWRAGAALTVVMATRGYPGAYGRGSAIRGIDRAEALPGVKVFHAGTALRDGALVAGGGRVLNITASGSTLAEAQGRAYGAVALVDWPEGFYRSDIGWRGIAPLPKGEGFEPWRA